MSDFLQFLSVALYNLQIIATVVIFFIPANYVLTPALRGGPTTGIYAITLKHNKSVELKCCALVND